MTHKQISAEQAAFSHAARLVREYRECFKIARGIAIAEAVIIAIIVLIWGCSCG